MAGHVLGLDLSLRGLGMCLVPLDWDGEWPRVITDRASKPLPANASAATQAERLRQLRQAVMMFTSRAQWPAVIRAVVIEEYSFSRGASRAHALGELGGIIKLAAYESGLTIETVTANRARTLLGKQPQKDAKTWAHLRLYAAGAPRSWSADECDAFLCCNWWMSENEGRAIMMCEAARTSTTLALALVRTRAPVL